MNFAKFASTVKQEFFKYKTIRRTFTFVLVAGPIFLLATARSKLNSFSKDSRLEATLLTAFSDLEPEVLDKLTPDK